MPNITDKINSIAALLSEWIPLAANYDLPVTGLSQDSRKIKPQEIFFACIGYTTDGRKYVDEAINNGAVAVLCEAEDCADQTIVKTKFSSVLNCDIPIFYVAALPKLMGLIAAKFCDYPANAMTIIGITGTNGKTSCCHFIARLLHELGCSCGVVGTLGAGFVDSLLPMINTTPDAITLQQQLSLMRENGARAVAMEVSSQALTQHRLQGVKFDIAVFTNLTRDHLGEEKYAHKDMQDYGNAKKILFKNNKLLQVVLNADDNFSQELVKVLAPSVALYYYGMQPNVKDEINYITACDIKTNSNGIAAHVATPWGEGELTCGLLGKFNISNLLAAISVVGIMGFGVDSVLAKIVKLQFVTGRMQAFGGKDQKPLVVVDYAHTPDALEQALIALREHCQGSLWCVFGCGGDKDRGKRSLMGQIAERHSDNVIITNDNPRSENPENIVRDIMQDLLCPWAVEIEYDRHTAITHALDCAQEQDVVLIAGKGHENYQIIGDKRLPFNDVEVVKSIINNV